MIVLGQNALIKHTGETLFWKYADTESDDYTAVRAGISDLLVRGNPGSSARGFEIADTYGYRMQRVRIGSKYDPQDRYGSGAAVTLHNETRWAEGVELLDVHSIYNQVGLRAPRSASSPSNSFNGLRTDRFEANMGSGQVGFELGLNGLDTPLYTAG